MIEVRAQPRASNQEEVAQPASGLRSARRAAAPPASARRQCPPGSSSGRGTNFSTEETQYMLGVVESHLPIHHEEWTPISNIFNAHFGGTRTGGSLRRIFTSLVKRRYDFLNNGKIIY